METTLGYFGVILAVCIALISGQAMAGKGFYIELEVEESQHDYYTFVNPSYSGWHGDKFATNKRHKFERKIPGGQATTFYTERCENVFFSCPERNNRGSRDSISFDIYGGRGDRVEELGWICIGVKDSGCGSLLRWRGYAKLGGYIVSCISKSKISSQGRVNCNVEMRKDGDQYRAVVRFIQHKD